MTKIKAMSLFDFHDSRNKRLYDGRKSRGLYELDLVKDPLSNSSKADLSVLTLSKVQQVRKHLIELDVFAVFGVNFANISSIDLF